MAEVMQVHVMNPGPLHGSHEGVGEVPRRLPVGLREHVHAISGKTGQQELPVDPVVGQGIGGIGEVAPEGADGEAAVKGESLEDR